MCVCEGVQGCGRDTQARLGLKKTIVACFRVHRFCLVLLLSPSTSHPMYHRIPNQTRQAEIYRSNKPSRNAMKKKPENQKTTRMSDLKDEEETCCKESALFRAIKCHLRYKKVLLSGPITTNLPFSGQPLGTQSYKKKYQENQKTTRISDLKDEEETCCKETALFRAIKSHLCHKKVLLSGPIIKNLPFSGQPLGTQSYKKVPRTTILRDKAILLKTRICWKQYTKKTNNA